MTLTAKNQIEEDIRCLDDEDIKYLKLWFELHRVSSYFIGDYSVEGHEYSVVVERKEGRG